MTSQEFSKKYSRPGVRVNIIPCPIENPGEYGIEVDVDDWPESVKYFGGHETAEEAITDYDGLDMENIIDEMISDGWEKTLGIYSNNY